MVCWRLCFVFRPVRALRAFLRQCERSSRKSECSTNISIVKETRFMPQEIMSAQNARASGSQAKYPLMVYYKVQSFPFYFQCIDAWYTHPKHLKSHILYYDSDIMIVTLWLAGKTPNLSLSLFDIWIYKNALTLWDIDSLRIESRVTQQIPGWP